ncbi:MAG: hypothetical protein JW816_00815 [Candidatus Buchananbacteria bacterium]|nr:hypothetical protein [Candidatus Buchananbacteria bacterium]
MPLEHLHILKKIKYLVAGKNQTKKQIANKAEENAQTHRIINERQEQEDNKRIDHAKKNYRPKTN